MSKKKFSLARISKSSHHMIICDNSYHVADEFCALIIFSVLQESMFAIAVE